MTVVLRLGLTKNLSLSHAADFHHGLLGSTVRVTFDSFTDWLDICIKDEIDLRLPGPRFDS